MMIRAASLLVCARGLLTACAGLGAPSSTDIQRLPVVRYGQAAPADRDFVLLYPAGADLPVNVQVDGSLLAKSDQAKLTVIGSASAMCLSTADQECFDGKNFGTMRSIRFVAKQQRIPVDWWRQLVNIGFSRCRGDVPGSNGAFPGRRDGAQSGVLAARF